MKTEVISFIVTIGMVTFFLIIYPLFIYPHTRAGKQVLKKKKQSFHPPHELLENIGDGGNVLEKTERVQQQEPVNA